jgi:ribonuclease BN (tRNA processing enzyme)
MVADGLPDMFMPHYPSHEGLKSANGCEDLMQLTFLGVRGSIPVSGPQFMRYGGHSTCIAVSHEAGERPSLSLDAGSGLWGMTKLIEGGPFEGSILLSHLHWDHMLGLPFFGAGDRAGSRVDVFLPGQDGKDGLELLSQMMSPPAFPITPEGLNGNWSFNAVEPGTFTTDGFTVTAADVQHKGGRTYGYRIEAGGASVGFVPDHAPALGVDEAAIDALSGVDILIHDAQYVESERVRADEYGHATVRDAVAFAERVGAGTLVLFHHGPHRIDEALDRITDEVPTTIPLVVASEGLVMNLPG